MTISVKEWFGPLRNEKHTQSPRSHHSLPGWALLWFGLGSVLETLQVLLIRSGFESCAPSPLASDWRSREPALAKNNERKSNRNSELPSASKRDMVKGFSASVPDSSMHVRNVLCNLVVFLACLIFFFYFYCSCTFIGSLLLDLHVVGEGDLWVRGGGGGGLRTDEAFEGLPLGT